MRVVNVVRSHEQEESHRTLHMFWLDLNAQRTKSDAVQMSWTSVCVMWTAGSGPVAGVPAQHRGQEDKGGVQELWGDDAKVCLSRERCFESVASKGTKWQVRVRNWRHRRKQSQTRAKVFSRRRLERKRLQLVKCSKIHFVLQSYFSEWSSVRPRL